MAAWQVSATHKSCRLVYIFDQQMQIIVHNMHMTHAQSGTCPEKDYFRARERNRRVGWGWVVIKMYCVLIRPCRGAWTLVTTKVWLLGKQINYVTTWQWSAERNVALLAGAPPIPIRPVGSALVCVCVCMSITHVQGWPGSHVEFSVRLALFGMLQAASFLMSRRWMSTGVNVPWLLWVPFHLSNSLSLSFYLYQAGTEFRRLLC